MCGFSYDETKATDETMAHLLVEKASQTTFLPLTGESKPPVTGVKKEMFLLANVLYATLESVESFNLKGESCLKCNQIDFSNDNTHSSFEVATIEEGISILSSSARTVNMLMCMYADMELIETAKFQGISIIHGEHIDAEKVRQLVEILSEVTDSDEIVGQCPNCNSDLLHAQKLEINICQNCGYSSLI